VVESDRRNRAEARSEYDVVVVGAGLAGLAFGYALRQTGLQIAIVDRQVDWSQFHPNWGNDLQPNALLALATLGLDKDVNAAGALHRSWIAERSGGGTLSRWDYATLKHSHSYAVCVRPHRLIGLLRERLDELDQFDLISPASFARYERDAAGWNTVRLATPTGEKSVRTRLLVGADGPLSHVRAAAGIKAKVQRYRHSWVNTVAGGDENRFSEGFVYFGRGVYLGVVPTAPDEFVVFHLTAARDLTHYRSNFPAVVDLGRFYAGIAPVLKDSIHQLHSWNQVVFAPALRVRSTTWVSDGVALVGDAALAVNQITSEGACLALEGAVRLATVVTRAFARADLSAAFLAPYEAWHRPVAEAIQELGDVYAWAFGSTSRVVNFANEQILRSLQTDPEMRTAVFGYSCGLSWLAPTGLGWRHRVASVLQQASRAYIPVGGIARES
jgi:2-polyprenyl-6-methoxyphenol hydroxylase-like FAD-dependent oxidoreductase